MPVPVWGEAHPGASVTVRFSARERTAKADRHGRWKVTLEALDGTAEGAPLTIRSGDDSITLRDVVVGEVWICSGQSNMQMGRGAVPELKDLAGTNLRTFEVRRTVAFTEQDQLEGSWKVAGPDSAVAFGFAHHLAKMTGGLPVGIILAAWGSSSIEAWMPRDMTERLPHFKTIMAEWDADAEGQARIRAALDAGSWKSPEDVFMRRQPNILYNAMIHPLVPYGCRGLVWYQGERNTRYISGMPESPWYHRVAGIREYDETLKAWMQRYREAWGRDDFHFLVVMLPGYGQILATSPTKDPRHPAGHSWAWMRESQLAALDLPRAAVANTIDLGDARNIHPKDKAPIGRRLALLAARDVLGRKIEARGPVFDRLEIGDGRLVAHFRHAAELQTTDGRGPAEFWIADDAGKTWVPARARIDGEAVILDSPELADPVHVRYAFTGKPAVNLVNRAGLPAYPFRTDSFDP
ncbi:MAG: sialate O-acetylesterase [Akkermansiaceae bacterium]|nr:sialate O-acetylesterase [Akkermansiaceae bacterium]NNM30127.1 sialate O-acetylesterase [Akkermansiaceae bacterium]